MNDPDASVLIVDDDVEFAQCTADYVRTRGFAATLAHTLEQTREAVRREGTRHLLLLDEQLPDGSGFELIDDLNGDERSRVALMTGEPSAESASRARSLPILDYVVKPLRPMQLDALLAAATAIGRTEAAHPAPTGMLGNSDGIQSVIRQIGRFAPSPASVLIVGESGTGKELAAKALHEQSGRKGPFVAVNCGAVAPELLASHLFGHERGSFTGATGRHVGYFEQAHRGTLFLDEITEMPATLQVYLLRALESGTVTRVGGVTQIAADVRVVAATNRDPGVAIDSGRLREDLFYRLADLVLELPPLRHRGDDILALAQLFLDRLNAQYGTHRRLAPACTQALYQHQWPGNIRELRSAVLRAFLQCEDDWVRVVPGPTVGKGTVTRPGAGSVVFEVGMAYADVEREMLLKTLDYFDQDKARTAAALGVSLRTIHNQLARMRA